MVVVSKGPRSGPPQEHWHAKDPLAVVDGVPGGQLEMAPSLYHYQSSSPPYFSGEQYQQQHSSAPPLVSSVGIRSGRLVSHLDKSGGLLTTTTTSGSNGNLSNGVASGSFLFSSNSTHSSLASTRTTVSSAVDLPPEILQLQRSLALAHQEMQEFDEWDDRVGRKELQDLEALAQMQQQELRQQQAELEAQELRREQEAAERAERKRREREERKQREKEAKDNEKRYQAWLAVKEKEAEEQEKIRESNAIREAARWQRVNRDTIVEQMKQSRKMDEESYIHKLSSITKEATGSRSSQQEATDGDLADKSRRKRSGSKKKSSEKTVDEEVGAKADAFTKRAPSLSLSFLSSLTPKQQQQQQQEQLQEQASHEEGTSEGASGIMSTLMSLGGLRQAAADTSLDLQRRFLRHSAGAPSSASASSLLSPRAASASIASPRGVDMDSKQIASVLPSPRHTLSPTSASLPSALLSPRSLDMAKKSVRWADHPEVKKSAQAPATPRSDQIPLTPAEAYAMLFPENAGAEKSKKKQKDPRGSWFKPHRR